MWLRQQLGWTAVFATSVELIDLKTFGESIKSLLWDSKKQCMLMCLTWKWAYGEEMATPSVGKTFQEPQDVLSVSWSRQLRQETLRVWLAGIPECGLWSVLPRIKQEDCVSWPYSQRSTTLLTFEKSQLPTRMQVYKKVVDSEVCPSLTGHPKDLEYLQAQRFELNHVYKSLGGINWPLHHLQPHRYYLAVLKLD